MKLGIMGLPNVGKSTLFNSLTGGDALAANYPFCTIEPNVGMALVPDERLNVLAKLYNSQKITPAVIEFADIAGLVEGASKGEGLGNKFLAHIREADALIHVVRCFDDADIARTRAEADPIGDIEIINLELILADLETIERRLDKTAKLLRNDKTLQVELDALDYLKSQLECGIMASAVSFTEKQKLIIQTLNLLTLKPVLYAANISEDELISGEKGEYTSKVLQYAQKENANVITVCAEIEDEVSKLNPDEAAEFLSEMGVKENCLDKIIKAGYELLGLISFLTAGPKEVRAWTIHKGTKAPQAAGKIHTDMQRGFIRAEIVNYDDLVRLGSLQAAKDAGLARIEGKDYVIADSDVILFRFNV